VFPIGDSALTVEFGTLISPEMNDQAIALSTYFENNHFPGFIESVPAYASISIFYDRQKVFASYPEYATSFDGVKHLTLEALNNLSKALSTERRLVEIPVHFTHSDGPDLELVAEMNSLMPAEVIKIFTSSTYRVYMLGFLPGFTYMGEVDERIATPRKEAPRELVAKGSVGIAGLQTGIYSLASPGGWQIIGRTDVEMFTPNGESPTYLHPGDQVRFVPAK
jgi:inhibitor of KinA